MVAELRSIEVDRETANALNERAAERGVSIAELVAELVPLAVDDATIAELDRRWASVERGGTTVSQADVERWLKTWGTPEFRAWDKQ